MLNYLGATSETDYPVVAEDAVSLSKAVAWSLRTNIESAVALLYPENTKCYKAGQAQPPPEGKEALSGAQGEPTSGGSSRADRPSGPSVRLRSRSL